jgi:hypothetical protein
MEESHGLGCWPLIVLLIIVVIFFAAIASGYGG